MHVLFSLSLFLHPCVSVCLSLQLMCLVGEVFEDSSDEVCGAFVQVRTKGDKIAIWTGNSRKDREIMSIG